MAQPTCPFCGEKTADDTSSLGKTVSCPACGGAFSFSNDLSDASGEAVAPPEYQAAEGLADTGYDHFRIAVWVLVGVSIFLLALIAAVFLARQVRTAVNPTPQVTEPETLEDWISQLKDGPGESDRKLAAEHIVSQEEEALGVALNAVVKLSMAGDLLSDPKPAISALADADLQIVEMLVEALNSDEENMRVGAAAVLCEIGDEAPDALIPLAKAAGDESRLTRRYSLEAVAKHGEKAADVLPFLLPLLKHEDRYTRRRTVEAIGSIGPQAKSAVVQLSLIEETDKDKSVRKAASEALFSVNLAAIADGEAEKADDEIRKLIADLRSGDENLSAPAARALGELGPKASAAVPAPALALRSDDKWLREAAAEALGKTGQFALRTRPMLERALEDPELEVRKAAQKTIDILEGRALP